MTSGPDTFGMGTPKFDFVDCESHALGSEVFCLCRADSTNITVHIPYDYTATHRWARREEILFYCTSHSYMDQIRLAFMETTFFVRAHHFMRLLSLRVGEIPL